MACGFPPSNTANAHEIRGDARGISAVNRKRTFLRLLTRGVPFGVHPVRLFRDEREKIICTIFAMLRTCTRSALAGDPPVLIENLTPRAPACAAARRTEQEPKFRGPHLRRRELVAAYCCGQTGGNRVIAPEIMDHFRVPQLWTGELDA
jgi:hypothetical protein